MKTCTKFLFIWIIGFSAQALTLTKGSKVFDEYKKPVTVELLSDGDCITVIENGVEFDAEVFDVSINRETVSFNVLDFNDSNILLDQGKLTTKRASRLQLRNFIIPGTLLIISGIPTVEAGPFGAAIVAVVGTTTATAVLVSGIASGAGAPAAAAAEIMSVTASGVAVAAAVPAP